MTGVQGGTGYSGAKKEWESGGGGDGEALPPLFAL